MIEASTEFTIPLQGDNSKNRNYFPSDCLFKGAEVKTLLVAYEKAAGLAQRSAKRAIETNLLVDLRRAQWDSAVVQTIESTLSCFGHTLDTDEFVSNEELELPDSPAFKP